MGVWPDSTVYQRHLAIHEPEANYVRRGSDSVDRSEDRVARWMGPPTSRDGFARDQLCDVGDWTACRFQEHAALGENSLDLNHAQSHRASLPDLVRIGVAPDSPNVV